MPLAVDFQGGVTSAWSNVITFVPKLAAALLIILVGYLLAKVVASVLNKVLERGGIKQALASSKYDPSDIIAKLASGSSSWSPCRSPSGSSGPTRSATCSRA